MPRETSRPRARGTRPTVAIAWTAAVAVAAALVLAAAVSFRDRGEEAGSEAGDGGAAGDGADGAAAYDGPVVEATFVVRNDMARDAFLRLGTRPLTHMPDEPCLPDRVRAEAGATAEVACRLKAPPDGVYIVAVSWFEGPRAEDSLAEGVARLAFEPGDVESVTLLVTVAEDGTITLERDE